MALHRYVVRFKGRGLKPLADVEQVRRLPGVTVIDESSRMLLIEGDDDAVTILAEALPGWVVAPEKTYPLPDTRKRLG